MPVTDNFLYNHQVKKNQTFSSFNILLRAGRGILGIFAKVINVVIFYRVKVRFLSYN